jgi:hypothetical protein
MGKESTPARALEATEAPLPAERAFVVQLRAQAAPGADLFVGRAEHIASGTAVRFGCAEDLMAFIAKVLASSGSSGGEPSASTAKEGETA